MEDLGVRKRMGALSILRGGIGTSLASDSSPIKWG